MAPVKKDITAKELRRILSYDPSTGEWRWLEKKLGRRRDRCGSINADGRRVIRINGRDYYGYRLAHLYVHGKWPKGQIDHGNVRCSDDRFENLRDASPGQNIHNRRVRPDSLTGIKGVSYRVDARLWRARIRVNGQIVSLGYFKTAELAQVAYAEAAQRYYGKFARAA